MENIQKSTLEIEKINDKKKLSYITERKHPHSTQNVFSRLFFWYLFPIFDLSHDYNMKKNLRFNLMKEETNEEVEKKFKKLLFKLKKLEKDKKVQNVLDPLFHYDKGQQYKGRKRNILSVILRAYKLEFFLSYLKSFCSVCVRFYIIYITKLFLEEIETQVKYSDNKQNLQDPKIIILYLGIIWVYEMVIPVAYAWIWFIRQRLAQRIITAIHILVYEKVLKIGVVNKNEHSQGNIINYLQSDAWKFEGFLWAINEVFYSSLHVVFGVVYGVYEFGYGFVIPFVITVVVVTVNTKIFSRWQIWDQKWNYAADERVKILKEVISSINYVKISVTENAFFRKIFGKRKKELAFLLKSLLVVIFINAIVNFSEFASNASFMYVYFNEGKVLTVGKITIMIKILTMIAGQAKNFSNTYNCFLDMKNGLERIEKFLEGEEWFGLEYGDDDEMSSKRIGKGVYSSRAVDNDAIFDLEVRNGYFYWDDNNEKTDKGVKEVQSQASISQNTAEKKAALVKSSFMTMTSYLIDRGETDEFEQKNIGKFNFSMRDVSIKLEESTLSFVIGKIGSGKSSLVHSILGEMPCYELYDEQSVIFKNGKDLCFVAQQPWLVNATVEENITLSFEKESFRDTRIPQNCMVDDFDLSDYDQRLEYAVKYSCLKEDLTIFGREFDVDNKCSEAQLWRLGLNKLIGENGIKVSGGQKVRIALARCLFMNCDIMIFDDIFSPLDAKTSSFIMNETILGVLKDKTLLVITHAVQYSKHADNIYIMDRGKIVNEGKYQELKNSELLLKFSEIENWDENYEDIIDKKANQDAVTVKSDIGSLLDKTQQEIELVGKKSKGMSKQLATLILSELGGFKSLVPIIILSLAKSLFTQYTFIFLENWAENFEQSGPAMDNLIKYGLIFSIPIISSMLLNFYTGYISLSLSKKIHSKMAFKLLHAKCQEFFSSVPKGLIINRFSGDLKQVDKKIYELLPSAMSLITDFIANLLVVYLALGWRSLIFIAVYVYITSKTQNYYLRTMRQYKRLIKETKTPIISTLYDSLSGLPHLRNTPRLLNFFKKKYLGYLEDNMALFLMENTLSQWFDLRIHIFVPIFIQLPSFILIFFIDIKPAMIGVFILSTFQIGNIMEQFMSIRTQLDAAFVSIERCVNFLDKIPIEDALKIADGDKIETTFEHQYERIIGGSVGKVVKRLIRLEEELENSSGDVHPSLPVLEFDRVSAKYISSKNKVVEDISFKVFKGEKIGIIGTTGSGKSTLLKLIWRYLDPSKGKILVGGVDAKDQNIKTLRRKFSLISQETSLFSGSLKENLDPSGFSYSENEMSNILNELGFDNEGYLNEGLNFKLGDEGKGLSQGERQLVSFARSILPLITKEMPMPMLLLDEATANIDLKTEEVIQRQLFPHKNGMSLLPKNLTMIVIAHRIQTVLQCDKIIVMTSGNIVEFDSPGVLAKKEDSYFKQILEELID